MLRRIGLALAVLRASSSSSSAPSATRRPASARSSSPIWWRGCSAAPAGRPRSKGWADSCRSTSAGSFRLRDAQGVWLEVDDARLEIAPGACSGARSRSGRWAPAVALNRLPRRRRRPSRSAVQPAEPARAAGQPAPGRHRPAVRRRARARPAGAGRGRHLRARRQRHHRADGEASAPRPARRTDQPTAELDLDRGLDLAAQSLSLDLPAARPAGCSPAATGRPAGALRLSLKG